MQRRTLAGIVALTTVAAGAVTYNVVSPASATPGQCDPADATYTFHGQGSHGLGVYYADADIWNPEGDIDQTMTVCARNSWMVDDTVQNHQDGAVVAYPNVHKDYINWGTGAMPTIGSLGGISSTFRHKVANPDAWKYDVAYDIWLNGVADDNSTELMIWTQYHGQTPAGSKRGTVNIGGHTFDFWATSDGGYEAFVSHDPITSGTFNLVPFMTYSHEHGFLPTSVSKTKLGQVDYGVEVVQTSGVKQHVDFTNFSVDEGTGMGKTPPKSPSKTTKGITSGLVKVRPKPGKTVKVHVAFKTEYAKTPNVTVTAHSAVPRQLKTVTVRHTTRKGFDLYLQRVNNTKTAVSWIATD